MTSAPLAGPFRLDPDAEGTDIEQTDWEPLDDAPSLQYHHPSHAVFEVMLDPEAFPSSGKASPFAFIAYLDHLRDGAPMPPEVELEGLGRAAIIACLEMIYPSNDSQK